MKTHVWYFKTHQSLLEAPKKKGFVVDIQFSACVFLRKKKKKKKSFLKKSIIIRTRDFLRVYIN